MKNLKKLVLANNRLEVIKGLNKLENLHKLNFKNNQLSTL
jgi:Leucine-rich repeat (LRR) protein